MSEFLLFQNKMGQRNNQINSMDPGFLKICKFFWTTILDGITECINFLSWVDDIVVVTTSFLGSRAKRTYRQSKTCNFLPIVQPKKKKGRRKTVIM